MLTVFVRICRRLPGWAALLLFAAIPAWAQAPSRVADLDGKESLGERRHGRRHGTPGRPLPRLLQRHDGHGNGPPSNSDAQQS
jgi:hypothetical protein